MQKSKQSDGTCSNSSLQDNQLVFQIPNQSVIDTKTYESKCIYM